MDKKRTTRKNFIRTALGGAGALAAISTPIGPGLFRGLKGLSSPKPNILFIFSDQQHWQALGFKDPFFETPNLDALAAGGVVFENSFCTTPQCSPSRSSLLTGNYPSKTGVMGNIGAAGGSSLAEKTIGARLKKAGYRTGYFGKWHLGSEAIANAGWDEEWKRIGDREVTRRAVKFLEACKYADKPFALFLSYNNPHDIYHFRPDRDRAKGPVILPESWHRETFAGKPAIQKQFMTEDQGTKIWGHEQAVWEAYREFYREKVRLYDTEVGQVLRALKDSGLEEETVVFASSDHGDMDTHHKLIFKGPFMYEQMVRIPLIVRMPGALGGGGPRRVADFAAVNVDIVPTLHELAGLDAAACDGVSLTPFLTGKGRGPRRDFVIGQYYSKQKWANPARMVRTAEFKYNHYLGHGEELYDLRNDPGEVANLVRDQKYGKIARELKSLLDGWIAGNNDPYYALYPTTRQGQRLTPPGSPWRVRPGMAGLTTG